MLMCSSSVLSFPHSFLDFGFRRIHCALAPSYSSPIYKTHLVGKKLLECYILN